MERSQDWMRQAERDFQKARLDLEHEYFEWACFTAHQAAEKALKAVHQAGNRSARGHALLGLTRAMEEEVSDERELAHAARILDRYYIEARYPNGFVEGSPLDYFDQKIAQEAIDAADRILRFCRDQLD